MPTQNPEFVSGPTSIPNRVRRAVDVQTADRRAPDFSHQFMPLPDKLRQSFMITFGEVLVFAYTDTMGKQEVAVQKAANTRLFTNKPPRAASRAGCRTERVSTARAEQRRTTRDFSFRGTTIAIGLGLKIARISAHCPTCSQRNAQYDSLLGECLCAAAAGLIAEIDTTLFDGISVGLQDLTFACRAVELAGEASRAQNVHLEQ